MKNQKGMTLIEIIVAMVICAIFVVCAIAVVSPVTKTYNRVQESSDAQMVAESLLEEMRGKTNLAKTLTTSGGTIRIDNHKMYVTNGYLMMNGDPVFDEKFYKDKTISMTTKQSSTNCVEVVINVYDSQKRELFTITSTLKPIA